MSRDISINDDYFFFSLFKRSERMFKTVSVNVQTLIVLIEPPLHRLQEIHKRVMALSFRDCHTKIRHVDAHATLNEGVVVQVMGELSNNMQPMRKFMQTFVLAPEVCNRPSNIFQEHNKTYRRLKWLFFTPPGNRCKQILRAQRRVPLPGRGVRRLWLWASRRWDNVSVLLFILIHLIYTWFHFFPS